MSDPNLLKVNKNLANPSLATGAPPAHCSAATPTYKQCCNNAATIIASMRRDAAIVMGCISCVWMVGSSFSCISMPMQLILADWAHSNNTLHGPIKPLYWLENWQKWFSITSQGRFRALQTPGPKIFYRFNVFETFHVNVQQLKYFFSFSTFFSIFLSDNC